MPKKRKELTVLEPVDLLIRDVRGERVILDADLARIYGVETRTLNQAIRRNPDKFPPDFLIQLTASELEELNRSQIVIGSQKHRDPRFLPYAFTEHGAIMAANVLNSPQAVQMSVFVVRAFVALRRDLGRYTALRRKLAELERTQKLHGDSLETILDALRQLEDTTSWAYPEGRRLIGFRPGEETKGRKLK